MGLCLWWDAFIYVGFDLKVLKLVQVREQVFVFLYQFVNLGVKVHASKGSNNLDEVEILPCSLAQ